MKEGDLVSPGPGTRLAVDQLEPSGIQFCEGRTQVGYPVGDVVKARPAALDEARDGTVRRARLEKLEEADEGHVHAVVRKFFDRGTSVPGDGFQQRCGFLYGRNRDADVIERIPVHDDRDVDGMNEPGPRVVPASLKVQGDIQ